MMLQDLGEPFVANLAVADNSTTIFDLPVESVSDIAYPPVVSVNGQVVSGQATLPYTFDYKYGVIAFLSPPGPGTLAVSGWCYDYWLDSEINQAVTDAFNLHTADLEPAVYIDPLPGQCGIDSNEQYLVSIMAAVEALWFRATDASQTIDIHTPEGVYIPRAQRYHQLMQQINALQEEYKTLSGALGVGIWRIQVLNQRRVSLTTNRLVPIFREQEYNAPYTGFWPTVAPVGAIVNVYGDYFNGATAVTFGGVPATSFTVTDDMVQATVPPGAQTGQIGVVTPYGVVLSTAQFVVGQPAPFIEYGPELVHIPIPPGK